MIPNPTSDLWLKKVGAKASWKITSLMQIFQSKVSDLIVHDNLSLDHPIAKINTQWKLIAKLDCSDEANLSLSVREAIHDVLDSLTQYLLSIQQLAVLNVLVAHITKVVEVLDNPVSPLNIIVLANKEDAFMSYYFNEVRPAVVGTGEEREERNVIWISLVFRMLCWLLLHDFDKADSKIVPADLKGSRMPVYIG